MLLPALCIISYPLVNSNWRYSPETPNLGQNEWFFEPCDLENWGMTSKNNRTPLLYYIKLCASFQSHEWIQSRVTVWKIRVKISNFLSRATLKITRWPWTRQIWGIWKLWPANSPETPNFGQNRWCFVLCDLEIWWMTWENKANLRDFIAATGLVILLKFDPNHRFFSPCDLEIWWMALENNRAPLLYYIKLCASFQIHRWIETEVTVRKHSIWVKMGNFLSRVTLKFDGWPCKTIGHLFYATSSFVYHFIPIGEFKFQLQSRTAQFGSNSTIFRAVRPWNLMDDLGKNRAPLLCYFKFCAAFCTHWWIQTGVTVRKRPIWVKFDGL